MGQTVTIKDEEEIRRMIEKYIELYNSRNLGRKINLDNVFINKCVSMPGAVGCYNENNKWYIYQVDDRFHLLVNGPYNKKAIITALANMLSIPSNMLEYDFSDEELRLFLQGFKPIE